MRDETAPPEVTPVAGVPGRTDRARARATLSPVPRQNTWVPMSIRNPRFSYPEHEPPTRRFFSTSVVGTPA
jgi:hypothetical protein